MNIWYETMSTQFRKFGLWDMETAPCVLIKQGMVVICYVDDLLVFFHQQRDMEAFKLTLLQNFVVKDLGHLKQFLGIELLREHQGMIVLHESALIGKLLSTYGMEGAKDAHSPMNPSGEVPISTVELNDKQAGNYTSVVRSLLYIAMKPGRISAQLRAC